MSKTIQEDFLYKKVYEFSYATFRVASSAKNRDIAQLLEGKGIFLLDSVLVADYTKTMDLVSSIISLTGLMVDSGLLHPVNREVLIRESESIKLAIEALPKKKEILPDFNLNRLFSKQKFRNQSEINIVESEIADRNIADEIADRNIDESSSFKSETRQSAITTKLQQTENLPGQQAGCRLNDLQTIFPNISERTIRYDLEYMISKGLVERVGSRRNSFYRLKKGINPVIELPTQSAINHSF